MGILNQKKDRFSFIEEMAPKKRKRKASKGIFDQGKDIFSSIKELAAAQRAKKRKRKGPKTKGLEPVDKAPAPGPVSLELGALKSAPYSLPNISDKKLLTLH